MGMPLGAVVNGRYNAAYVGVHSDKDKIRLKTAGDVASRSAYFVS